MEDKDIKRFWSKVNKVTGLPCWLWTGSKCNYGYGIIAIKGYSDKAHRVSYRLAKSDPGELCVLHKCDTPACVNPEHLFLGTRQDNNLDRVLKNRDGNHKGVANGRAKLTDNQVKAILEEYKILKTSYSKLALKYRISKSAVAFIIRRKHWTHIV